MQTSRTGYRIGTILLMFLIMMNICSAFVKPIEYKGTQIKIYENNANKTAIFELLDQYPDKYFDGLDYIKFQPKSNTLCGFCWWGSNGIDLYGEECWNKYVLTHELAHDLQYKRGDSLYELMTHTGRFYEFEEEIEIEVN